jgi:hypothetical protein
MRAAVVLVALALTGCMSNSQYKVRDANGWPVPTWAARQAMVQAAQARHDGQPIAAPRFDQPMTIAIATKAPTTTIHAPAQPPPPPAPPPTIGVVVQ